MNLFINSILQLIFAYSICHFNFYLRSMISGFFPSKQLMILIESLMHILVTVFFSIYFHPWIYYILDLVIIYAAFKYIQNNREECKILFALCQYTSHFADIIYNVMNEARNILASYIQNNLYFDFKNYMSFKHLTELIPKINKAQTQIIPECASVQLENSNLVKFKSEKKNCDNVKQNENKINSGSIEYDKTYKENFARKRINENVKVKLEEIVKKEKLIPNVKNFNNELINNNEPVRRFFGLENNGQNYCFINCILQCLSHTPDFTYLLSKCNFLQNPLLREMESLLKNLAGNQPLEYDDQKEIKSCKMLKNIIAQMPENNGLMTEPQKEQDAAEFLLCVLNMLNGVLHENIIGRNIINESKLLIRNEELINLNWEFFGKPDKCTINNILEIQENKLKDSNKRIEHTFMPNIKYISILTWILYMQEANFLEKLFTGKNTIMITCGQCHRVSTNSEIFRVLTVPIPCENGEPVQLLNCLANMKQFEEIVVNEDSGQLCKYCTKKTSTPKGNSIVSCLSKEPYLSPIVPMLSKVNVKSQGSETVNMLTFERKIIPCHLPPCLIIQLMRFRIANNLMNKLTTPISITCDEPTDLEYFLNSRIDAPKYQLYGVCLHSSSHYTSYVRCQVNINEYAWYYFNDEKVSRIKDMQNILDHKDVQQLIYLLFYHRIF